MVANHNDVSLTIGCEMETKVWLVYALLRSTMCDVCDNAPQSCDKGHKPIVDSFHTHTRLIRWKNIGLKMFGECPREYLTFQVYWRITKMCICQWLSRVRWNCVDQSDLHCSWAMRPLCWFGGPASTPHKKDCQQPQNHPHSRHHIIDERAHPASRGADSPVFRQADLQNMKAL